MVVGIEYLRPLAEQLSAYLPVFIVEMPGFGLSRLCKSRQKNYLDIHEMIEVLREWMETLQFTKLSLFGNSFGCQLVVEFAAAYPQFVDRCVLQGPTTQESRRTIASQVVDFMRNGSKEPISMSLIMLRDYFRAGLLRSAQTFRHVVMNHAIERVLPQVQCPVLIVSCERDPISPRPWCAWLSSLTVIAHHVHLKGAAHTANYNSPRKLARMIRPFLECDLKRNHSNALEQQRHLREWIKSVALQTPESTDTEKLYKPIRFVADYDSGSVMLRATSNAIHGESAQFGGLESSRMVMASKIFNHAPISLKRRMYQLGGWWESTEADVLTAHAFAEQLAADIVRQFPRNKTYSCIVIGSANGALCHAFSAMRCPWLPQTVLVPVRRPARISILRLPGGVSSNKKTVLDFGKEMEWGKDIARRIAERNPGVAVHHMADPNQDAMMIQEMAYFRIKFIEMPIAYQNFLREALALKGHLLVVDCTLAWPVVRTQHHRAVFQPGAFGGIEAEEYLARNDESSSEKHLAWTGIHHDSTATEAEWGFANELLKSITVLCNDLRCSMHTLRFSNPEDPSAFVADLFRTWYESIEEPSVKPVFVSSFVALDPWQTIRRRLVPYWSCFPILSSMARFERFVDERGDAFSHIYMTFLSYGAKSKGHLDVAAFLENKRICGIPVSSMATDPKKHPLDFTTLPDLSDSLAKTGPLYPIPPAMSFDFFSSYLQQNSKQYKELSWT
eukprot:ANDGO_04748.mRNA.1 hypothetical protein